MPTILSLAAKHAGLEIANYARKAKEHFDISKGSSNIKADSTVLETELNAEEHRSQVHRTRRQFMQKMEADQGQLYLELSEQLTKIEKTRMTRIFDSRKSCRLTAKMSERDKFFLSNYQIF